MASDQVRTRLHFVREQDNSLMRLTHVDVCMETECSNCGEVHPMSGEWDDICESCLEDLLRWCGYIPTEEKSTAEYDLVAYTKQQTKESPHLRPDESNSSGRSGRAPPPAGRVLGTVAGSTHDD